MDSIKSLQKVWYEIQIEGVLDSEWSEIFNGMIIYAKSETGSILTTLRGPVVDQAQLRGILNKIWDLNLKLVYLKRIPQNLE